MSSKGKTAGDGCAEDACEGDRELREQRNTTIELTKRSMKPQREKFRSPQQKENLETKKQEGEKGEGKSRVARSGMCVKGIAEEYQRALEGKKMRRKKLKD